ncbi:MAG: hypothetical protein ACREQ2_18240 [Candidatus Binatia bacterium]
MNKICQSVSSVRAALYAAFSSPNLGITWAMVTFLSGLLYLTYNEHKRQVVETRPEKDAAKLENGGEAANIDDRLT